MIQKVRQSTLVFNSIAIVVLFGSMTLFYLFGQTKEHIETISIDAQIQYIDAVTDNISEAISTSTTSTVYETLKNNTQKREVLENGLSFIVTEKYRYVYVVDRENNNTNEFRFLLDGSTKNEKAEFAEPYTPLNIDIWNTLYETKQAIYFRHSGVENVWITYLKPIVIDSKVSAIIVIDFSLQASQMILDTLSELSTAFEFVILFAITIFFVIIWFSYVDSKREKIKRELHSKLVSTNKTLLENAEELEEKSLKISQFNKTLKQKVAQEIQKSKEKDQQLLQQSKLAQMGDMISMIAHQWRQPLNAISASSINLSLLSDMGVLENNKLQESSEFIQNQCQAMSSTIETFMNFVKPSKESKEFEVSQAVELVMQIMGVQLENHNIKVNINVVHNVSKNGYEDLLEQVILNLLTNARDAFGEVEREDKFINITIDKKGNIPIITIEDNAGGIPQEIQDKVFNPYFTTKEQGKGTGIGLYMSLDIMKKSFEGDLVLTTTDGGSRFEIICGSVQETV